jgi:pseudouridine-5'-phosphate glycosidase
VITLLIVGRLYREKKTKLNSLEKLETIVKEIDSTEMEDRVIVGEPVPDNNNISDKENKKTLTEAKRIERVSEVLDLEHLDKKIKEKLIALAQKYHKAFAL